MRVPRDLPPKLGETNVEGQPVIALWCVVHDTGLRVHDQPLLG
jgi:hypothetical protein